MQLVSTSCSAPLDPDVISLISQMVSPFTGVVNKLVESTPDRVSAKSLEIVSKLSSIHRMYELPTEPAYHLGGHGVFLRESMYRALGESLERYAHMVYPLYAADKITYSTYQDLAKKHVKAIGPMQLTLFTDEQYERHDFPFERFGENEQIGWIKGTSLISGEEIAVPCQCVLVGYMPRKDQNEPWIMSAVTTGSAAHTSPEMALRSALLELIEINSTMIAWYAKRSLPVLDISESPVLSRIFSRYFERNSLEYAFLYASTNLKPHVVITLIFNKSNEVPSVVAGAAADLDPVRAVYRSMLEANAITALVTFGYVQHIPLLLGLEKIDHTKISDLDRNVAFYADRANKDLVSFLVSEKVVSLADLEGYPTGQVRGDIQLLREDLIKHEHEVVAFNITTPDIERLGFHVVKTFSPSLVPLCIPSYPFKAHAAFSNWGGVVNEYPHPFP